MFFLTAIQKFSNLKEFSLRQYDSWSSSESPPLHGIPISQVPRFLQEMPNLTKLKLDSTEIELETYSNWVPGPCLQELKISCNLFKFQHPVETFDPITRLELARGDYPASSKPLLRNLQTLVLFSCDYKYAEMLTHFVSLNPNLVNLALVECRDFSPSTSQLCKWLANIKRFEWYTTKDLKLQNVITSAPKLHTLTFQFKYDSGEDNSYFPMQWLVNTLLCGEASPDLKRIYVDLSYSKDIGGKAVVSKIRRVLEQGVSKEQAQRIVTDVLVNEYCWNLFKDSHNYVLIDVKLLLHYWAPKPQSPRQVCN